MNELKKNIMYVLSDGSVTRINPQVSLRYTKWDPRKKNVILINGYTGKPTDRYATILKNGNI